MIKFTLKRFGGETVEFDEKSIITFPAGMPGFETCKRFKLIHEEGKPQVLFLQSLDRPEVLFSLGDPALLNLSYEVMLSDEEQKLLGSGPGDELAVAVMIYKDKKDGDKPDIVKVNTLGPIILNVTKRLGMQKIIKAIDPQMAIRGA